MAQDYTVYAIDLLGFGASDKPQGFSYTMEAWAEVRNLGGAFWLGVKFDYGSDCYYGKITVDNGMSVIMCILHLIQIFE